MEDLSMMEKDLDYQAVSLASLQDEIPLSVNYKSIKEEIFNNYFNSSPQTSPEMVVPDEIEIKEEPIEYNDNIEIQHETNESELVPTNEYIQRKENEYFQFYKESKKIDNSIESNIIKSKEIKGSVLDALHIPQNISSFSDLSKKKSSHFFSEKTQCIIPLENGFAQYTKSDKCGQMSEFKEFQTINQSYKNKPIESATSKSYQPNKEISKGNRENLIAQAVHSALSALNLPKANGVPQLETSDRGSSIDHPSDSLRNKDALDSINLSQSVNKRPIRTSKESANMRISASVIEECFSQTNMKKLKIHKSRQSNDPKKLLASDTYEHINETAYGFQNNKLKNQGVMIKVEPQNSEILDKEDFGWNWETNSNNFESQDRHFLEHKDKFSISDDNDVQESSINKLPFESVSIENIKKENINCEDSISIENNKESNYMKTYLIKPKGRIKRRRWIPDEDGMYSCNLCSYKAKRAPYLKRHMITHAIDKPYTCHVCNKSLCSFNSLKMHLDMHNGVKNYHCSLCDQSFRQKIHLKTHMSKHHKESKTQPNQLLNINAEPQISKTLDTGGSTITSSGLDTDYSYMKPKNERQNTGVLNEISSNEYSKDIELNKYNNEYSKDIKLNNSKNISNICTGKLIELPGDALMIDNNLEANDASQSIDKNPDINSKISKEMHMTDSPRKESSSLKKAYVCHICNKSLSSCNSLKMHLDIHNGIKKYHCSLCGSSFRQKVHLKTHMSKHHKESNKQPKQHFNIDDSSITYSEPEKNDSFTQPDSEIGDSRTSKVISNSESSINTKINKSGSTSKLIADSLVESFDEPLVNTNSLEDNNTFQNVDNSSDMNKNIFKGVEMSDSQIKECNPLEKSKCLKINELADFRLNCQANYNHDKKDSHSSESKDELGISVENEDQKDNINRISENNILIESIKKEAINCDDNVDEEINIGSNIVEMNSTNVTVKKVKKKRQRWVPGKDGMYACNLCTYKAKKAPYLKRHMITHTNEKPYKCHICDKRFNHFNSLKYHLDVHNDIIHDIRKYNCHLCEYSFIQKGHLKSHLLQHSREERYQLESNMPQKDVLETREEPRISEIDKKDYYVEPTSLTHNKQNLEAKAYGDGSKDIELNEPRCTKNLIKDSFIESNDNSLTINNDVDTYHTSCNINNSPSKSDKILEGKHINVSVTEEYDSLIRLNIQNNNKLKKCGMNWQINNNNNKSQNCQLPESKEKSSLTEENLNSNIQGNNTNISTEDVPIENIKKEISNCEDSVNNGIAILSNCKRTFSNKRKKKKVYRWIAGEDGMFSCNLCSYKAKQAPYLKRHLITHLIDKPYKCHICSKSFCSYNSLKMHLDMHNGIKKYHCSLCGHSFIQKAHLKTHMMKHTGEKKYPCEYCEKKFSRPDHVRTHMVVHSDERPFACDECDLKFKNKSNLYHHKRNHANDRRYNCQECDASFMLSNTLRGHLASHLVYRKGCKVCPECPLFFWSPSQFISHLSKRHGYSTEKGEQTLKNFMSEANFRFYFKNKKKKKIISKELGENACKRNNEICIKEEVNENNEKFNPTLDTFKILDGSKGSEEKVNKGVVLGLELLSSMDLNQPIVTCTNRQVLRSSTDSQFLVITYNSKPNDEIKQKEYFKFVKEDQGGLTIKDIQGRFISYYDVESKIINGDENLDC